MGSIRLKYILLVFIFSHHIVLTTSAINNSKLLLAAGIVTAALMSTSYGYYSWTPSAIALLTAILLIALIPTSSDAVSSCTAPGYAVDPVLGCVKLYKFSSSVAYSVAAAQCASDGGSLLLVNSAAENSALVSLMNTNMVANAIIQGTRTTSTDPWLTDSGQPLPYIANIEGIPNVAGQTKLLALNTGSWQPINPTFVFDNAVCEIL